MGSNDRAYRMNSHPGKKYYSDRHPDHSAYLYGLVEKGFYPHEWVQFKEKNLTRDDAFRLEKELIKQLKPRFNRKGGPKYSLTKDQVYIVKRLYKYGQTYDDLAFMMDCSHSTIGRIIKEDRGEYIGKSI